MRLPAPSYPWVSLWIAMACLTVCFCSSDLGRIGDGLGRLGDGMRELVRVVRLVMIMSGQG